MDVEFVRRGNGGVAPFRTIQRFIIDPEVTEMHHDRICEINDDRIAGRMGRRTNPQVIDGGSGE
jgi:hypothetical protein